MVVYLLSLAFLYKTVNNESYRYFKGIITIMLKILPNGKTVYKRIIRGRSRCIPKKKHGLSMVY